MLSQLHDEGDTESQGEFTLDEARAASQLQAHGLSPGLYLLKLIQAAVALGCSLVKLSLGVQKVRFEAELTGPGLSRADVCRAVRGPFQPNLEPPLRQLAWAWQAVLSQAPAWARISCPEGCFDSRQGWIQSQPSPGFVLRLHRRLSTAALFRPLAEHRLCSERCAYTPVPVLLHGRPINNPGLFPKRLCSRQLIACPSFLKLNVYRRDHPLVERNLLSTSQRGLLAPLPSVRTTRNLRVGERLTTVSPDAFGYTLRQARSSVVDVGPDCVHLVEWRALEGPQPDWELTRSEQPQQGFYPLARCTDHFGVHVIDSADEALMEPFLSQVPDNAVNFVFRSFRRRLPRVAGRLLLRLGLDEPGWLLPVIHGVALDPIPDVDLGCPGALALVADDRLATDLSQLQVVRDEAFQTLLVRLRAEFEQMKQSVPELLQSYPDWVRQHILRHVSES